MAVPPMGERQTSLASLSSEDEGRRKAQLTELGTSRHADA